MPDKQTFDDGLISPNEAIDKLCSYVGSEYQARLIIADGLHEGTVTATANHVLEFSDKDPTDPWKKLTKSSKVVGENVEVLEETWRMSFCWPEETRFWDWDTGNFIINASEDMSICCSGILLEGVRFNQRQVLALIGRSDRSGVGGRRPDTKRWARFWTEFMFSVSRDFDWSIYTNRHLLKLAMAGAAGDTFSDTHIDEAVMVVWEKLEERRRRERGITAVPS